VVQVGEKGLTDSLMAELERALEQHELIKVKISFLDREDVAQVAEALIKQSKVQLVQKIGKMILIYRPAKKANPKLSNLLRYKAD
jgi:RNA-binding protein